MVGGSKISVEYFHMSATLCSGAFLAQQQTLSPVKQPEPWSLKKSLEDEHTCPGQSWSHDAPHAGAVPIVTPWPKPPCWHQSSQLVWPGGVGASFFLNESFRGKGVAQQQALPGVIFKSSNFSHKLSLRSAKTTFANLNASLRHTAPASGIQPATFPGMYCKHARPEQSLSHLASHTGAVPMT